MNATRRIGSAIPWAIAAVVGIAGGAGLTAFFIDEHANKTCGLIASTVGLIVLIPGGLGLAALVSLFVATRAAEDTKRLGMWLLVAVVLAAGVFLIAVPTLVQQIPPGCHRNG
jgi:uncharacterized membrane protein YjjB (DUF3815 family)